MKKNKKTQIYGSKVILVPYRREHVPKYHQWMKSQELQLLTASEPLTLEQEYEMQQSWSNDEDKCTFIILDQEQYKNSCDEIISMIGDTNLFLQDNRIAEAEIMIAETKDRSKRKGWEAMCLMFRYGIEELKLSKFIAKISNDNEKSLQMFTNLKFSQVSESAVFKEITLERPVDDEWRKFIESETSTYRAIENSLY